jgi:hypothetical protein
VHRLPREVLRKRDRHRTSTKFRLGVIRRIHELCKLPSNMRSEDHVDRLGEDKGQGIS